MSSNELIKNEELILTALASGSELYGLQIIKLIEDASDGEILINYGSLYPLLNKLTKKGYVKSYWEEENARKGARRKYYRITDEGMKLFDRSQSLRERLKQLAGNSNIEIPLSIFEFETVTVDSYGKIVTTQTKQAQYFTEQLPNGITLEMVYVPGSSFMMGSPKSLDYQDFSYREGREFPQHLVTVPDFYLGKYPVTQEQWSAVASLPKIERELKSQPAFFPGKPKNPVEQISWEDAQEFCQRLSQQANKQYRLPREAEWEYACRGGTTTPFSFGTTITEKLANYNAEKTFADEPKGIYLKKTTEVGLFPPNTFGLYDLHGNVWEWCEDDWYKNYDGAPDRGQPRLLNSSSNKVIRGGSWDGYPDFFRSAYRSTLARVFRDDDIGFRVVCVAFKVT